MIQLLAVLMSLISALPLGYLKALTVKHLFAVRSMANKCLLD
jgi:hypothetical protein